MGDLSRRKRIEEITERLYGRFSSPQSGHAYLMCDGWWTGHLVHHRPASEKILAEAGVTYEKYFDIPTFIEHTFAIRAELLKGELNLQIEGWMSKAQENAVMKAFTDGIADKLVYDFQARD